MRSEIYPHTEYTYKVFGIGLNKTGTKTLGHSLETLGFKRTSFDLHLLEDISKQRYDRLFNVISSFSAFEDWPYPLVYKEIDINFPGNKFILTKRSSPSKWLQSLMNHSLRTDPERGAKSRTLAYGFPYPQINPEAHLKIYQDHLDTAREYFRGRDNDFLEVCWEDGDDWNQLCNFLQIPKPSQEFPHMNKSPDSRSHANYNQNGMAIDSLIDTKAYHSSNARIQPIHDQSRLD